MRLITLGTGGCFATPTRQAPCAAVEVENEWLIFDAGENTWRRLAAAKVPPEQISAILLTHFHGDHIGGLAPLLFGLYAEQQRKQPLLIAGPNGLDDVRLGLAQAFGDWLNDPGFELNWLIFDPPGARDFPGVCVSYELVEHSPSLTCLGYRITTGNKTLAVSGDTGICEGLRKLAQDADVLLVEAGSPDDLPLPGHVTPTALGTMAAEVGVKKIVLTHFSDPALAEPLTVATQKAFGGEVVAANDGDVFLI